MQHNMTAQRVLPEAQQNSSSTSVCAFDVYVDVYVDTPVDV